MNRYFGWIPAGIARIFWSLLGLNGDQQRALMTWAMIGAIVAMSGGLVWGVDQLISLVPASRVGAETLAIIAIIGDVLKMVVIMMSLFCGGMVLIARGGEMTIKTPGGLEISARGAGAKELAKSTDLVEAAKPPADPPPPAPEPPIPQVPVA